MSRFYTNVEKRGSKIYLKYADTETQRRGKMEVEFQPQLYVAGTANPTSKNMQDEPLEAIKFDNMKGMSEFIERYKGIDGYKIYGQKDPIYQFITKYFPGKFAWDPNLISGGTVDIEVFSGDIKIEDDGSVTAIPGPFPEPTEAAYPISMLTIRHRLTGQYHVWGLEWFKGHHVGTYKHNPEHERVGRLPVVYKGFETEQAMLNDMLHWWHEQDFDLTTGWYYEEFDVPYMVNRCRAVCGPTMAGKLSPWGVIKDRTIKSLRGDVPTYEFMGSSILDMLNLFKKHGYMEPPNWKLGTIAEIILGETKISYEEEGTINNLYILNYQKSVEYNIIDVDLVHRLDDKMQFLLLTFVLAYMTKSNYPDTLATVKPWSALAYSKLNEKGIQPELRALSHTSKEIVGGFVKEVRPGKYRWAVSGDLNSLYPHLMQQYNLGIETLVEPWDLPAEVQNSIPVNFSIDDLVEKKIDLSVLKKYNLCMTANRQFFRRDRMAIFNELTREIYTGRALVKKDMKKDEQKLVDLLEHLKKVDPEAKNHPDVIALERDIATKNNTQQAFKILMNGLYGAIANKYFTEYYDVRIAEGITTSGQLSIKWVSRKLNEYFNNLLGTNGNDYVIANDTDSCYLCLELLVDRIFKGKDKTDEEIEAVTNFLDKLFKTKIEPFIDECYKELADYVNAHDQRMFMKRETIATAAIWAAKKRYVMHAMDVEGVRYPHPKVKFTGVDAKRSSFPKKCREWMVECYGIALSGTEKELQARVKEIRDEYMKQDIADIAQVTGVNNLDEYSDPNTVFRKGSPAHVKATLFHNKLIKDLGVTRLKPIQSGDKILMVRLKPGNPKGIEAIAFQGELPEEFGLRKYVDYAATFDRTFLEPVMNVMNAINWNAEAKASVMDFFS